MCETSIRIREDRESQEDILGRVILIWFNWHNNASTPVSFNLEISKRGCRRITSRSMYCSREFLYLICSYSRADRENADGCNSIMPWLDLIACLKESLTLVLVSVI